MYKREMVETFQWKVFLEKQSKSILFPSWNFSREPTFVKKEKINNIEFHEYAQKHFFQKIYFEYPRYFLRTTSKKKKRITRNAFSTSLFNPFRDEQNLIAGQRLYEYKFLLVLIE